MKISFFNLLVLIGIIFGCSLPRNDSSNKKNEIITLKNVIDDFNSIKWNTGYDTLCEKKAVKNYNWENEIFSNTNDSKSEYTYEIRRNSKKTISIYQSNISKSKFEFDAFFEEFNNSKFLLMKNVYITNNEILDSYFTPNFFYRSFTNWIVFGISDLHIESADLKYKEHKFNINVAMVYSISLLDSNLSTQKKITLNEKNEVQYMSVFKNDKFGNINEVYYLYPNEKKTINNNTNIDEILKIFSAIPDFPSKEQSIKYLIDTTIFNHKEWNSGYQLIPPLFDESYIIQEFKAKKIEPILFPVRRNIR